VGTNAVGTSGADTIAGSSNDDILDGGDGSHVSGFCRDLMYGGARADWMQYSKGGGILIGSNGMGNLATEGNDDLLDALLHNDSAYGVTRNGVFAAGDDDAAIFVAQFGTEGIEDLDSFATFGQIDLRQVERRIYG
jgi:hypothetical protein